MVRYIEWKDLVLIKKCICPYGSDRNNHWQDMSPHNNLINN